MSRPSTLGTLCLFARTGVRRVINRTILTTEKLSKKRAKKNDPAAPAEPALRTGTVRRGARKSTGGRALVWLIGLSMMFGLALLSVMPAVGMIASIRVAEMRSADMIPLARPDFERLQTAAKISDETERQDKIKEIGTDSVAPVAPGWVITESIDVVRERFEARGIDGFQPVDTDARWQGDLALLSPEGRTQALHAIGLFLFAFNLSLALSWFGMMGAGLKASDGELSWLLQFPVSRRVLFLSKLIANSLDNPAIFVTPFVALVVLFDTGFGTWTGWSVAVLLGISAAVAFAGFRMLFETLLVQKLSRKARGTTVAFAAMLGSLGIMVAINGSSTPVITNFVTRMATSIPAICFWNPWSACVGAATTEQQISSVWWLAAPIGALAFAAMSVIGSAKMVARGLNPMNDTVRLARKSEAGVGLISRLFRGTIWKELLQILRQREILFQIILAPVPMIFILWMKNPNDSLTFLTRDAGTLCTAIFTVFAYLLMVAAGSLLRSELKTLWFLQCAPRSLADTIRTKARVWAALVTAFSLTLLLVATVFASVDIAGLLTRLPFLVVYLWLFAEITFGLVSVNATIESEDRVSIRLVIWLMPMFIGSVCGEMLHAGGIWEPFAVASVLFVLSLAVREKQQAELRWLTEPVEKPPVRLYSMHGLLAVLAFIGMQSPLAVIFRMGAELSERASIALAYDLSAAIVTIMLVLWILRSKVQISTPITRSIRWKQLATSIALVSLVGAGLVGVLQFSPDIATASQNSVRFPTSFSLDQIDAMLLIGMIVIVAPVFEEWIFRGLLFRSLRKSWGLAASIAITTLLFTVIHPAVSCAAVVTLSIVTCLLVEKTGRIWPGILAHMALNAVVVLSWNLTIA